MKCERNLNFSAAPGVHDEELNAQKRKVSRDPMSHRIIEKRRRDRMNNCLADLSSLIPSNYLKKGRGRIEKTEIIEIAIKHLKYLQTHQCKAANGCMGAGGPLIPEAKEAQLEQYRLGYQECLSETMHFLVEIQVCYPGDPLCVQIVNHLQKHQERVLKGRQSSGPYQSYDPVDSKRSGPSPDEFLMRRDSPGPIRPTSGDGLSDSDLGPKVDESAELCSMEGPVDVQMTDVSGRKDASEISDATAKRLADLCQPCGVGSGTGSGPECGSQLREMLQNPLAHSEPRERSLSVSSRPISTASSSSSTKGDEVYKFKTNIKERFRADQRGYKMGEEVDVAESESCQSSRTLLPDDRRHSDTPVSSQSGPPALASVFSSSSTGRSYANSSLESSHRSCSSLGSLISETIFGAVPPSPFRMLPLQHPQADVKPSLPPTSSYVPRPAEPVLPNLIPSEIAIFALHPKGSFYVPLTIDASLVSPSLNAIAEVVPTVLHHVAIAVHFSRPAIVPKLGISSSASSSSTQPSPLVSLAQEPLLQRVHGSRLWSPSAIAPGTT